MSPWEKDILDAFLADAAVEGDLRALLEAVEADLAAAEPGAGGADALRERVLEGAAVEGRFDRFLAPVAELMDVDEGAARLLLDGIGRPDAFEPSPLPEVSLYHIEGGPKVEGAVTGFVRMPGGAIFPEHEHLGDEAVLVVQGSFEDGVSGQVHRPGELVRLPAGTRHDFRARPGPDLVYLVVVQEGVKIGDLVFGPDAPEM